MAAHRKTTPEGSTAATAAAGGTLSTQDEQSARDRSSDRPAQPSAGRTGKLGARAERPADSRASTCKDSAEPGRSSGKAPAPAARDKATRDEDTPQPMRDTTG